jgi:hypothetical protein
VGSVFSGLTVQKFAVPRAKFRNLQWVMTRLCGSFFRCVSRRLVWLRIRRNGRVL